MNRTIRGWVAAGFAGAILLGGTQSPATAIPFTYQGRLDQNGQPATGTVDLRFRVYTSENGDILLSTSYADDQLLTEGRFTAEVDFGPIFNGQDRWLSVSVRPGSFSNDDRSDASYTALTPRQYVTATPHAQHAFEASGLDLPIDETLNLLSGPSFTIRNSVNTAIKGISDSGVGAHAFSESGTALYATTTSGWAGNFSGGPVYVQNRLAVAYSSPTTFKLACNGDAAKPGGGSWSVLSDRRFKTNIRPLEGALDRLLSLDGVTFEYTEEAREGGLALPGVQIGLIAQDVEEVFPDWVGQDGNGMKFVTERGTTALMVEALRELRGEKDAQIKALQDETARLLARIESLERGVGRDSAD